MRKHLVASAMLLASLGTAGAGAEPFIGEIQTYGFDFCPRGWAPLHGQLLPISQNTALFSLLGTRYGGDGRVTFALPVGKPVYSLSGEKLLQCIALEGIYPSRP